MMPIYAFTCPKCGQDFEELVPRVGAKAPCPRCGEKNVELKVSAPSSHHTKTRDSGCSAPPRGGFR